MLANSLSTLSLLAQSSSGGDAAAGAIGLGLMCCFGLFGLLAFGFWLWMLIDCCTKRFPGDNDKLIWVLVIVLTGAIGALVYFFVGRPKGTKA